MNRSWWAWIGSLALTAGLFAYLLSDVELRTVLSTAKNLAPAPLAWFGVLLVGSIAARALRFWILLGRTVPFKLVAGFTLVRNLFVDLLPARLGELSLVYLVVKRGGRHRFLMEPLHERCVVTYKFEFDCLDGASGFQEFVVCLIDNSHPTLA